jgi:hypothetical protein
MVRPARIELAAPRLGGDIDLAVSLGFLDRGKVWLKGFARAPRRQTHTDTRSCPSRGESLTAIRLRARPAHRATGYGGNGFAAAAASSTRSQTVN